MNTQSSALPEPFDSQGTAPAIISATRPLYWSIRRELWEYRAIYVAPLITAGLFLAGYLINLITLRARMHGVGTLDAGEQHAQLAMPYQLAAGLIMSTTFLVGIFYSLDALYGERRDRSILFWKSLPVSDLTTVLAKVTIPIVILPLLAVAVAVFTQWIMLLLSSVVLLGSGIGFATIWTQSSFLRVSAIIFYHFVTVHGLWYAPLYGWLLLVSAWARRAPILWASLPPFVIYGVEKIAFNTTHFLSLLEYRLMGPQPSMTSHGSMIDELAALTPAQFFGTPGLWTGLALAAVFLFLAARLRRYRGPI